MYTIFQSETNLFTKKSTPSSPIHINKLKKNNFPRNKNVVVFSHSADIIVTFVKNRNP